MMRSPAQMRDAAAAVVEDHAARFFMDVCATERLVDAIKALSLDDGQPDEDGWIKTGGKKPDLADHLFVIARHEGESREEAEAWRDGYGEPVGSIRWHAVTEYRLKRPEASAS